jgi:hypothetical protein
MNPLAETLRQVGAAFEACGISYVIGGSVASSARGIVRATYDVDLVARIHPSQAAKLAAALGGKWYADPDQMRSAIASGRSFNLIDLRTGYKVDIFPATDEFHFTQLQRATRVPLPFLEDHAEYPVSTSEDILLAKLKWYADGGEVSDRQWSDIVGIINADPSLDLPYVEEWATRLGVARLLARALDAARAG